MHIFKWVHANPGAFLVGIRRITAYHVDYTTEYTPPEVHTTSRRVWLWSGEAEADDRWGIWQLLPGRRGVVVGWVIVLVMGLKVWRDKGMDHGSMSRTDAQKVRWTMDTDWLMDWPTDQIIDCLIQSASKTDSWVPWRDLKESNLWRYFQWHWSLQYAWECVSPYAVQLCDLCVCVRPQAVQLVCLCACAYQCVCSFVRTRLPVCVCVCVCGGGVVCYRRQS